MAKQEVLIGVKVAGLKFLDDLSKGMEESAKAGEAAVESLDKATKSAEEMATTARKSARPVKKLGQTLQDTLANPGKAAAGAIEGLTATFNPLGFALVAGTQALNVLSKVFGLLSSAIDKTIAAVNRYIANNEKLSASSGRLTRSIDDLVETFGAAVIGGEGFAEVIDFIAEQFGIATKIIKDNAGTIFEVSKEVVDSLLTVVKVGVHGIAGLASAVVFPFDLALTGIRKFRIAGLTMIQEILKEIGPSLVKIGVMTQESLTDQINITKSALAEIPRGNFTLLRGIASAADVTTGKITELQEKIRGLSMGALGVGTGRARGGGGGPLPPNEMVFSEDEGLIVDRITPTKERTDGFTMGQADTLNQIQQNMAAVEAFEKRLEESLAKTAARAAESDAIFTQLGDNISGALTGAFVDLASSVGQFMGAFAAGTATLSEFGDAVADMMGGLASTMGRFFIEAGAAFLAGGFVGQGIGMIAAGVALNALGGVLGGVGSGNRGSGAGAAASGAASTVAREVQRSLRGPADNRINQTIEVVIAGRSIEPEMVNVIDQVVRLGRSRSLARRGV